MYTYIKNSGQTYVAFENPLNPVDTALGVTWEDYVDGKLVFLSDEQVKFHEDHPEATVRQVWDMLIPVPPVPERTLDMAKAERVQLLEAYDTSENVNIFFINDSPIWLDKETRVGLKLRFESEKSASIVTTTLWYKDQSYTLNVDQALQMLLAVELYASNCYDNTCQHRVNVNRLETIEEVDNYDYTANYPEKLHFVSNEETEE